jgi:hypothetical protein
LAENYPYADRDPPPFGGVRFLSIVVVVVAQRVKAIASIAEVGQQAT